MILTPSLHGSTNNSIVGDNTPRIAPSSIDETDNMQNQIVNIEIHEIEPPINNPSSISPPPPISAPTLIVDLNNLNNLNNGDDADDNGALM
jgi:hypothetical protein